MSLVLVCGPPCAGKSTYVEQRKKPEDRVLDVDLMAEEIYGRPYYSLKSEEKNKLQSKRDKLALQPHSGITYLVTCASGFAAKVGWMKRGAEIVVINPGKAVCLARLEAETRRPESYKPVLRRAIERYE